MTHWHTSFHHDGAMVRPLTPSLGDRVHIRVRVDETAPIRTIYLRTTVDGEQMLYDMKPGPHTSPVRWFRYDLDIQQPRVAYHFLIQADDGVSWFNAAGMQNHQPLDALNFQILVDVAPPDWTRTAVFYQIFPDTFANGDPSLNPAELGRPHQGNPPVLRDWGDIVDDDAYFHTSYFGGDLKGVEERLDYLEELGVDTLYLNPIFTAASNHRYDTVDYTKVDPALGGDEALISLRKALDRRGMRYILDVTPNHCSTDHQWFQDALQDPASPHAGFFTFDRHPDDYRHWMYAKDLAKLNYQSELLRDLMYRHPQSVLQRWLRAPFLADGWRIDVANMIGRQGPLQINADICSAMRRAVKDARPDAYLLGENFFDASPQLQGDQWDAVMNYLGFSLPLGYWLGGFRQASWLHGEITSPVPYATESLVGCWRSRQATVPWVIARSQYNLLGSHDTTRIRSRLHEDADLVRIAVITQFAFPGIPGVYYGDEIGMADVPKYDSRGCMIWDEKGWDHDLRKLHQDLIQLRRSQPALQDGGFQLLMVDQDVVVFMREVSLETDDLQPDQSRRVLLVANRAEQPLMNLPVRHGGIPDGAVFRKWRGDQQTRVEAGNLTIPALSRGASIWLES